MQLGETVGYSMHWGLITFDDLMMMGSVCASALHIGRGAGRVCSTRVMTKALILLLFFQSKMLIKLMILGSSRSASKWPSSSSSRASLMMLMRSLAAPVAGRPNFFSLRLSGIYL